MSVPKRIESDPEKLDLELPSMIWLTQEEAQEDFDRRARDIAGVSGDEFIRRLRAGDHDNTPGDPAHWDLIFLSEMAPRLR